MNGLARQVYENAGILFRRFLLSSHSVTRAPPHIRDANNVQRLWNYFVIASLPALAIVRVCGEAVSVVINDEQVRSYPPSGEDFVPGRTGNEIPLRFIGSARCAKFLGLRIRTKRRRHSAVGTRFAIMASTVVQMSS